MTEAYDVINVEMARDVFFFAGGSQRRDELA